jgi:hypothetical protein
LERQESKVVDFDMRPKPIEPAIVPVSEEPRRMEPPPAAPQQVTPPLPPGSEKESGLSVQHRWALDRARLGVSHWTPQRTPDPPSQHRYNWGPIPTFVEFMKGHR